MLGGRAERVRWLVWSLLAVTFAVAGCGSSTGDAASGATSAPSRVSQLAHWTARVHVAGVVDMSARRADGSIVVAAAGRLRLLLTGGTIGPFAPTYSAPPGLEPYIALSSGQRVAGAGCRFGPGAIYALRLQHGDGVTVVDARG